MENVGDPNGRVREKRCLTKVSMCSEGPDAEQRQGGNDSENLGKLENLVGK